MTVYSAPGSTDSPVTVLSRYENYVGGEWTPPAKGDYFENITPVTGKAFTEVARSHGRGHRPRPGRRPRRQAAPGARRQPPSGPHPQQDRRPHRGEPRDARARRDLGQRQAGPRDLAADLPLAVDHFRYFAGCIRAQEGAHLARSTATPWLITSTSRWAWSARSSRGTSRLLMATWKLAPALAAGNCVVLKPAEQTPASILVWMELIGDLLPPGVLNIVNGFGAEAGKPLASSSRIAKIAFTGETTTGRLIPTWPRASTGCVSS